MTVGVCGVNESRYSQHTAAIHSYDDGQSGTAIIQKKIIRLVFRASPCVKLCEMLIHFWSVLIVTGFALFTTWAESMEGLCHTVTHSLYFPSACWVQGGISNPLIVLLLLWFANKYFLACVRWQLTSLLQSLLQFSLWDALSVYLFLIELNGKTDWITLPEYKEKNPFLLPPLGLQPFSESFIHEPSLQQNFSSYFLLLIEPLYNQLPFSYTPFFKIRSPSLY